MFFQLINFPDYIKSTQEPVVGNLNCNDRAFETKAFVQQSYSIQCISSHINFSRNVSGKQGPVIRGSSRSFSKCLLYNNIRATTYIPQPRSDISYKRDRSACNYMLQKTVTIANYDIIDAV